ncbi:o-succinylbenzoate synthase [Arthrobacter sp. JZ12]|uniref:o-succinylbenzoate synthase n=1 Tax=Arthrobacter sp. JZ12 TaxID=2654190 RepID=UPI002B46A9BB|nr:o-succinylbenzoate synthase [Arthrobacter sp. JZ12]WRH25710.1 o-succinylbenzoate synthase [Arthrobacter sp. JZ12]
MELPSLEQVLQSARVVSLPMRVRFRGVAHREALLLRGPAGWGEFSPFPEYDDVEAAAWLQAGLEAAWLGHTAPVRSAVSVNATVPAVEAAGVERVLARFGAVEAVKIKVAECGQNLDDDVARVAEVRRLLPAAKLRVDANGGWTTDAALEALERLADFDLEYAEQPVLDLDGLRRVRLELRRRSVPVLIAADESVRKAEDPLRVAREDAADLLIVKVAPLGGVRRALDIVARSGLPAVVSSALDTSVGISAGVALAASLPELRYACGLGTLALMEGDVTDRPLAPVDGLLEPRRVTVSEELLERHAASPAGTQWWLDRLQRVHRVLTGGT